MTVIVVLIIAVLAGSSMMVWGLGSILVRGFSSRKMGIMLLLGGFIIVANASLYVRDHYWENAESNRGDQQPMERIDRATLLNQPESICRLLIDHGFGPEVQSDTGKIWGQANPMFYSCQAHKLMHERESPTRFTYRVQSADGQTIDLLRLEVDIVNDSRETAVLDEFKQVAGRLFARLPVPRPDGFNSAIDDRIFRRFDQEHATVALLRDRHEQGYRLRMEIRPDARRP